MTNFQVLISHWSKVLSENFGHHHTSQPFSFPKWYDTWKSDENWGQIFLKNTTPHIFAHSTLNFHPIFKFHTILESYQQHGRRGVLQVKIWALTNEIWAFQKIKIACRNFLLPSNLKILFLNSTLMDLLLKAWKRKLVNWASELGFWRKKYWNNARIKIWPRVK